MESGRSMSVAVAIASCLEFAAKERDDLQVIAALRLRGIEAVHAAWDDESIDWKNFELVVIRSAWDYPLRLGEFLAWAGRLPRVLNSLPVLQWNTNKRYLKDLSASGVPVVPTQFLESGELFELPEHPFVVKPAVSCGARDTALYQVNQSSEARGHIRRLLGEGRAVMFQPYLAEIERSGEISLMFIGGVYSHAVYRAALLHEPGSVAERAVDLSLIRRFTATPDQLAIAKQALAAIPLDSDSLLYARVDLIPGANGEPLVLEVELTEPYLFLDFSERGVEMLADSIARAVGV
jgi:glutathione synthase/RimK-type ligase-like ATP-grasp enzyme